MYINPPFYRIARRICMFPVRLPVSVNDDSWRLRASLGFCPGTIVGAWLWSLRPSSSRWCGRCTTAVASGPCGVRRCGSEPCFIKPLSFVESDKQSTLRHTPHGLTIRHRGFLFTPKNTCFFPKTNTCFFENENKIRNIFGSQKDKQKSQKNILASHFNFRRHLDFEVVQ